MNTEAKEDSEIRNVWHRHSNGGGWVEGTARVSGDAWVEGTARVSGYAHVFGNAWVLGDAWSSSPLYIQGTAFSLTNCRYGYIHIGCYSKTLEEWREEGEALARKNFFTTEQIEEYRTHLDLFARLMKHAVVEPIKQQTKEENK